MQDTAALLCLCAHRILCEVQREGERLGSLIFFDNEPESETNGQRVDSCPKCGQRLGLLGLSAYHQPG